MALFRCLQGHDLSSQVLPPVVSGRLKTHSPSHIFHQFQPPSKLQTSPINLREWISRLWAFCGNPIRVKLWSQLSAWMKRLYRKDLVAAGTGGGCCGCYC